MANITRGQLRAEIAGSVATIKRRLRIIQITLDLLVKNAGIEDQVAAALIEYPQANE